MTKIKKSSFPKEATAKLMVAVEYYNTNNTNPKDDDATTTFEIFDSLKEAWKFANSNKDTFLTYFPHKKNLCFRYLL